MRSSWLIPQKSIVSAASAKGVRLLSIEFSSLGAARPQFHTSSRSHAVNLADCAGFKTNDASSVTVTSNAAANLPGTMFCEESNLNPVQLFTL